jgi:N-acetylneuraminic acid mutarotase
MGPRLESVVLALVLGWTAGSTATGWQQVAPLPEPRWMHVAACDLDGRVYAYAGYTASVPEARDYGLGQRALDIFDPKKNAWRRGPGVTKYRAKSRVTKSLLDSNEIGAKPIREWIEWREYETGLRHEKPAGAAGRDGLIYWFGEAGPIHFDPKRGVWDQHALPISDNATRSWLPPVPRMIRMSSLTATAPDGKIYLVGGIGHPLNRHERDPRSWHQWPLVDAVEVYDPATNTWEERLPMPRPRQEFAGAFGPDGKLYVFGGFGRRMVVHQEDYESEKAFETAGRRLEADARQALRSVEAYDPATDTWSERAPMPEGRHAMGAALGADGRIYVIGGAVSYSNPIASRSVFVYDPKTDRWEEGPRLGQARFHHAVAVDPSGRIYAVGGIENHRFFSRRGTASVEVLNTFQPSPKPAAALPNHE